MATRTISNSGGTRAWSDTASWVEGAVPTSADEVVATGTSGNLTIAANSACRSIDLTGYVGTLTHNSSCTLTVGDATDPTGNNALIFPSSGWTYTLGSATTSAIVFARTSGTALNVNFGGQTVGNLTFGSAASGSWKLTGNVVLGSASTLTVTRGTLDGNGNNVTCGLFSSSNTNVRTITMGSGTWTLTGNAATIFTTVLNSNLTFNPGNAFVCNYSGSTGTRTISVNTLAEASSPSFSITAGSDTVTFTNTAYTAGSLDFTGFSGTVSVLPIVYGSFTASSGMTLTTTVNMRATSGTKTITSNGKTFSALSINGAGGTFQLGDNFSGSGLTLTAGTFNANGKNVTVTSVSSSGSGVRTLTMGSGTWTLTGSSITVWNTSTATNLTLNPNTASVVLSGTSQTLNGSPTFYNLTKSVVAADALTFTDGTTQTVTNSLTLTGSSGQLLTLQGTSTGGWTLAVPSTQSIGYVSVSRSTATGNTALAGTTSTDGGNNTNWNFGPPVNTVAPAVTPSSGNVGDAFSCTTGTWTGSPTSYSYQWKLDGSNVGTNSSSYTPVAAGTLTCTVTPSNAGGAGTPAVSNSVTVVAGGNRFAHLTLMGST